MSFTCLSLDLKWPGLPRRRSGLLQDSSYFRVHSRTPKVTTSLPLARHGPTAHPFLIDLVRWLRKSGRRLVLSGCSRVLSGCRLALSGPSWSRSLPMHEQTDPLRARNGVYLQRNPRGAARQRKAPPRASKRALRRRYPRLCQVVSALNTIWFRYSPGRKNLVPNLHSHQPLGFATL